MHRIQSLKFFSTTPTVSVMETKCGIAVHNGKVSTSPNIKIIDDLHQKAGNYLDVEQNHVTDNRFNLNQIDKSVRDITALNTIVHNSITSDTVAFDIKYTPRNSNEDLIFGFEV